MSLREELIQIAAVAVAIVTDMDFGHTGPKLYEGIIQDVKNERRRQEDKWGPRHLAPEEWLAILAEDVALIPLSAPKPEREGEG